MRKRLLKINAMTVEAFNTFGVDFFLIVLVTSVFVLPAQWWLSAHCVQSTSQSCELALFISNYWWVVMALGIALAMIAAIVKWLFRLIYSAR